MSRRDVRTSAKACATYRRKQIDTVLSDEESGEPKTENGDIHELRHHRGSIQPVRVDESEFDRTQELLLTIYLFRAFSDRALIRTSERMRDGCFVSRFSFRKKGETIQKCRVENSVLGETAFKRPTTRRLGGETRKRRDVFSFSLSVLPLPPLPLFHVFLRVASFFLRPSKKLSGGIFRYRRQ